MDKVRILPLPLSETLRKLIFFSLSLLSFLTPFFLHQSQFVTGVIVNAALFISAILLPGKYFLPVIFFPSLGALSRGLLFGPLTHFLFFLIPFIWLGNFILIYVFKKLYLNQNFILSAATAAVAKSSLLFLAAHLLFSFDFLPRLFLTTMGVNQLITALAGGLVAYLILKKFGDGKLKI